MLEICGTLSHVGNWRGGMLVAEDAATGRRSPRARLRGEIDRVVIGGTTLEKPACTEGLFPHLEPGREACLYLYKHFFVKQYIIGVKYTDDGTRHVMPANEVRGTILQYIVVWPLIMAIPGLAAGALLGLVFRFASDVLPPLGLLASTLLCWWSAFSLWRDVGRARSS